MRRARRVDENQSEIVDALRAIGASVEILSDVGRGVPDLLVGYCGRNVLLEVKADDKERLTREQRKWHDDWRGAVFTVSGCEDALQIMEKR